MQAPRVAWPRRPAWRFSDGQRSSPAGCPGAPGPQPAAIRPARGAMRPVRLSCEHEFGRFGQAACPGSGLQAAKLPREERGLEQGHVPLEGGHEAGPGRGRCSRRTGAARPESPAGGAAGAWPPLSWMFRQVADVPSRMSRRTPRTRPAATRGGPAQGLGIPPAQDSRGSISRPASAGHASQRGALSANIASTRFASSTPQSRLGQRPEGEYLHPPGQRIRHTKPGRTLAEPVRMKRPGVGPDPLNSLIAVEKPRRLLGLVR
jgi:hypothetical protein